MAKKKASKGKGGIVLSDKEKIDLITKNKKPKRK